MQVLIGITLSTYAVDDILHPPCSSFGFLIMKVELYGWARILFDIIAGYHVFLNMCILFSSVVVPAPPTDPLSAGPAADYK